MIDFFQLFISVFLYEFYSFLFLFFFSKNSCGSDTQSWIFVDHAMLNHSDDDPRR